MSSFLFYSIKSGLCLLAFYLLYRYLLQKLEIFSLGRVYLLSAAFLSLIIPLLSLPSWVSYAPIVDWGEVVFDDIEHPELFQGRVSERQVEAVPWSVYEMLLHIVYEVYFLGLALFLGKFIFKIVKLRKLVTGSFLEQTNGLLVCHTEKATTPFSFFHYVFLNGQLDDLEKECVIAHEAGHARRMHSADIILFELVECVFWWNPLWKIIRKKLAEIHEYQVDKEVSKIFSAQAYSLLLLKLSQRNFSVPVASHFAYVSLKNRIKMIKKNQYAQQNVGKSKLQFLWTLPLISILLISFSTPIEQFVPKAEIKPLNYLLPPKSSGIPSILPLQKESIGKVTAKFGLFMHPILKEERDHKGVDFSAATGTSVIATAAGKVFLSEEDKAWGKRIIIDHGDGYQSHYGHLSKILVTEGQEVEKGFEIGKVGNTGLSSGPHLHYGVKYNNEFVDPMDYFTEEKSLRSVKGM
ncbi:M23/M56 family metallopeptidase [Flammeovirgaceae bacterium SG7u.111]|nr:M23/M56 family metallopeptidase [Flammeovirgaceae bacterium SG7u.132]WPO35656.1 M23/M56 family metallopeptidase [Flammeovirgaceae bacterium SG7u.111]